MDNNHWKVLFYCYVALAILLQSILILFAGTLSLLNGSIFATIGYQLILTFAYWRRGTVLLWSVTTNVLLIVLIAGLGEI
jgi:hypothetical protein